METGKIMAYLRVFCLHSVGMRFGANMFFFRQDVVGAIMVSSVHVRAKIIEKQQLLQRLSTTRTDPEGEDILGISVNSQPQPELAVFLPT